jgi:1,4-dihydroxy-2-naphthoate octaprenyltransferase
VQAARPLAHANIAPPLLFGQALAAAVCGHFSWRAFAIAHAYGVLAQLFIVFSNDVADWQSDAGNRTFNLYSGGSRVIPEGKLTPRQVAFAALLASVALSGLAAYVGFGLEQPLMFFFAAATVGLVWAYNFPPLRLSYRGRGELLQALGVGVVLPAAGFYAQCGALAPLPWPALIPAFMLGWAGNLLTSLPDYPSDRVTAKNTFAVRKGPLSARRSALFAIGVAACAAPLIVPRAHPAIHVALCAAPIGCVLAAARLLQTADAEQREACRRFVTLAGAAANLALAGWTVALFLLR